MSFQTHTPNKQSSPASANKSAQSKQENDTAPKAENSFGLTGSMSARRMMQLQRTMGNQAVQRMVSGAAAPHTAIQRSPAAPVAAPAPAPQAAPQRLPASADPKSLRSLGEYWGIYQWLKNEADASGKSALFGYFDNLSKGAKMAAIKKMADDDRPDLYKVKEKMITGIFSKKFDWGKFSEFSREANAADTQNYNADQDRDYASYAAIGTSSAAGGVSGSAKISSELGGAKGAVPVGLNAAPVAAGLSGAAALSQMYNATQNYDSTLSSADKAQLVVGEGGGGAADFSRFAAQVSDGPRAVASAAVNTAAGVGAIAGGAAYMVSGAVGYHQGRKNAAKLAALEEGFAERAGDERATQLGHAAHLGGSTQTINKNKSAATAVKGAMMIAGGVVMLAAAASPIGPLLIAAAGILGGIAAIVKFYKKYKRKETFVDRVLQTDEVAAKPENQGIPKEKVRQKLMEQQGFNSVDQCYVQIVTDLAGMLYDGGVKGEDEECRSILEGMGLRIDKKKMGPSKELIAKKLHA